MTLWENFGKNEIYLIILNVAAYIAILVIPKKFKPEISVISLMLGFTVGILFDFTIGGGLLDFYKVNDLNNYELSDLFYYFLFAPFGYFFFYFYETFRINKKTFILYVVVWALFGVAAQWLFTRMEIITLQKGYKLSYSFPIFLMIQTITGIYIELIKSRERLLLNTKLQE